MTVTMATRLVAVLGGLISLAIFTLNADYTQLFGPGFDEIFPSAAAAMSARITIIIMAMLFPLWVVLPFLIGYRRAPALSGAPIASWLFLIACLIAAISSAYVYWSVFIVMANPDPQDGLVFLALPFWQLLGVGSTSLVANMARRFE